MKGSRRYIHHLIQTRKKFLFIRRLVSNPWHVDGNYSYRAGTLAASKEAAGLLTQFSQIQAEAAAHASDIAWLHVAVDIVRKIWCSIFGGHFKEKPVVLCIGPVKITGNGVGRDWILEAPSVGIPLNHDLDECLVDHIHLFLAVSIGKIHLFSAYDGRQVRQVIRNGPVQRNVGKWCLGSPA